MKNKYSWFWALVLCVTAFNLNAQKYGYVDTNKLLIEMPSIKAADSELETFQTQLVSQGQTMVTSFENAYNIYVEAVNTRTLSQVQMQQREMELQKQQQTIQQYEQEMQQKILKKREDLYQPILDQVKQKIEAYGKANNFTMIFDTSMGAMLYVDKAQDLTAILKTELGF